MATAFRCGLVALLLLACGELLLRLAGIPQYLVPYPTRVYSALVGNFELFARHGLVTFSEAVGGFLVGGVAAILGAIVFVRFPLAHRIFFPFAVVLQTVPIVVLAPLLVLIFGNGKLPKVIVAALICFFPTLVNMTKGLSQIDTQLRDVFLALNASEEQVLTKLRLPSSLPDLFSSLKIASANCVIGAILGEWIAADEGIGYLLAVFLYQIEIAKLYSAVVASSLIAITLFCVVRVCEALLVPWKEAT